MPGSLQRCAALGAVLASCVVFGAAPAAAQDPLDEYYAASVAKGGWLNEIGWSWDDVEDARDADVAFPTIAVVDSGIDIVHKEFVEDGVDPASADCSSGRAIAAGPTFTRLVDTFNHGTIVSGLAAAPANGVGIVGASPYSPILAVKIRAVPLSGVECALAHIVRQIDRGTIGLVVVNLSLADARRSSPAVQRAVRQLVRRGALVVAATGNRSAGGMRVGYPARLPHVLSVGDMENQARLPGPELDVLAPGGELIAPLAGAGWGATPGGGPQTSWSTALVSGAAAAVWGAHPGGSAMTAQQLAWLLRRSASHNGVWKIGGGFGTISFRRALDTHRIPADDESEPNDTAALASAPDAPKPFLCGTGCTVGGIAGTTDDREDWWPVRRARNVRVCQVVTGPGARGSIVTAGPRLVYVRVKATKPLVTYSLRIRVGAACS